MKKLFFFLIISLLFIAKVDAQIDSVDYTKITLPTLDELFAGARKNPTVTLYSLQMQAETMELKTQRRLWLSFINLHASSSYGIMSINSYSNPGVDLPMITQSSGSAQLWYNVGVSIGIPVGAVYDRRNRINKQKMKIKETEMEIERWFDDQKLKIIDAYTTAKLRLSIIKFKAESASLATAQYNICEKEFMMGKVDSYVLNNNKNVQAEAFTQLEEARIALNNALLRLEVLCNMKIINN